MKEKNNRFNLVSLGCPKNRVDSERILFAMKKAGFNYTDDPSLANIIIINTCAFIQAAVEESIGAILDFSAAQGHAFLVVAGCMPLRYCEELGKALPEVNLFITPDQIRDLPTVLKAAYETRGKYRFGRDPKSPPSGIRTNAGDATINSFFVPGRKVAPSQVDRVLSTPGYAYLKIAEGCNRSCRYCTIPTIRGPLKSTNQDALITEASFLAALGVRELVLTAQDLTSYGLDRKEKGALIRLLERIREVHGIEWVRLMYLHPNGIPRGLGRAINESETILPYLDIPLQHISDKVLRDMGRPWKGNRLRKLIDALREEVNGLVLRTTLMVGFPGEGEKEFKELCEFVESFSIEHVGVFEYSPEEGTPAFNLGDPIPQKAKHARAREIRRIHSRYIARRNRGRVGTVEQGLIEGISQESEFLLQGRTWEQAPEVDGVLFIVEGEAQVGDIYDITITGAHGLDLFGAINADTTRSR